MNSTSFNTGSNMRYEGAQIKNQQNKFEFKALDTGYAWLCLLLGYLLSRTIPVSDNSLGALLYTLILLTCGMIYIKLSGVKLKFNIAVFAAVIAVYSVGFITCGNGTIRGFLFLFLICIFAYWVYASFGLSGKNIFNENLVGHFISAVIINPFKYIWCIFPGFVVHSNNKKSGKLLRSVLWALLGLAIAVIPTAIIISLLSYDDSFTALLDKIFDFSFDSIMRFIGDIHLGFIFATLLYGVLFGSKRRSLYSKPEDDVKTKIKNCHVMPRALVCTAVTPVLLVYILFFISQWNYYISAFTGVLPNDLTYAEYAREGFFQLCWVCAMNALMLLLFNIFIKGNGKQRDVLKSFYTSVISLFSLVLITTALSKMLLYINTYGLTRKRVYVSWLIIVLAVFFIIVLLKQLIRRLPMVSLMTVAFILLFALISIPDVDSMIASYNVDAYLSGKHDTVDLVSLKDYGSSAVPALIDLNNAIESKGDDKNTTDEQLLVKSKEILDDLRIKSENDNNSIFSFNIPDNRAKRLLDKYYGKVDAT